MRELYLAADDLTGALDTGVQFAKKGVSVAVFPFPAEAEVFRTTEASVLVENLNTRHMSPKDAYQAVYAAVRRAKDAGFTHFYKKTDSALRGHVAEELSAMMEASEAETMEFIPAFPVQGRTTKNGIQYINGVPAAESDLAHDPFNPIIHSSVKEILELGSMHPCRLLIPEDTAKTSPGEIGIYDCTKEKELLCIGQKLKRENKLFCLAGCAGFSSVLPELIPFEYTCQALKTNEDPLFIICGSIHSAVERQLKAACENGFFRLTLSGAERLDPALLPKEKREELLRANCTGRSVILDVISEKNDILPLYRQTVSDTLAFLTKELLDAGVKATLLVTGGDTLMSVLRVLGCRSINNMTEIEPGVVLSVCICMNGTFSIVSKAGSFGQDDLFLRIEHDLILKKEVNPS